MRCCYDIAAELFCSIGQKLISEGTSRFLLAHAAAFCAGADITAAGQALYSAFFTPFGDKAAIRGRGLAAQHMIKARGTHGDAYLLRVCAEIMQQAHGVCAARDGAQHAVAGRQQHVFFNKINNRHRFLPSGFRSS